MFNVSCETPITDDEALSKAADLEKALGEIANGQRKPGKLPVDALVALICYTRAAVAAKQVS